MDIMADAGAVVGKAAVSEEGSNERHFKFAVLSRLGMFDPSYLLGVLKSEGYLDEDEATWSQFINVFPYAVPFFNTIDEAEALSLSQSHIYNMLMLNEIKDKAGLSYQKWREVGDNQKKLWKDRLKKKYGAILDTGIEAFEYGDLNDDMNIFKLEAIVEHYLDVKEPWDPNIPVILLTDSAQVNFLNPEGLDAQTVSGSPKTVKINDFQLTDRDVSTDYDYIKFDDDIKDNGIYLIKSFNKADSTLVLDNQPDFGAIGKSGWKIVKSPNLVLIDPFGGNYKGDNASVKNPAAPQIIALPELPAKALINTEFDTIYFRDDTRRTSKTYFIKEYDSNARTVTLDWPPEFPNGRSSWSISGGVGGTTSESPYKLGPGGNKGYDNYFGVLFVIYNSKIIDTYLWSSYTSRNYANFPSGNMLLSSIQGNMSYSFKSITSDNAYKNYSYKIMDYHTDTDKCSHAKYYFTDSPNAVLDNDGKTMIRFHYGEQGNQQGVQQGSGTGSAGCLVSPNFNVMRDRLIEFYQEIYRLKNKGNEDAKVNKIYQKDHKLSKQIWTNSGLQAADWNNKIFGTLWLVRPDEKPL
ncbi:MAG TPA: hypothetical protein VHT96_16795 [Clostridia bacterium]|nr:hypothetical protein [Clostridia bacterium]